MHIVSGCLFMHIHYGDGIFHLARFPRQKYLICKVAGVVERKKITLRFFSLTQTSKFPVVAPGNFLIQFHEIMNFKSSSQQNNEACSWLQWKAVQGFSNFNKNEFYRVVIKRDVKCADRSRWVSWRISISFIVWWRLFQCCFRKTVNGKS